MSNPSNSTHSLATLLNCVATPRQSDLRVKEKISRLRMLKVRYYVFSIDYEYSHFEGTISETDFLARMGSLSMKTVRLIGGAFVSEDPSDPPNPLSLPMDSDDSLR